MRLNNEHYEVIVNYAEKYPVIITNKFVGLNSKEKTHKLWETLVNQLNSLGYGALSIGEYKRRITDWKSKIKAKASTNIKDITKTGGGEGTPLVITRIEQRLLSLMGDRAIVGDKVEELGVKRKPPPLLSNALNKKKMKEESSYNIEEEIIIEYSDTVSHEEQLKDTHPATVVVMEDSFVESNCEPEGTHLNIENTSYKSPSTSRRRNIHNLAESVQEMNQQNIAILKNIDKNLEGINNNLFLINRNLEKALNFLEQ